MPPIEDRTLKAPHAVTQAKQLLVEGSVSVHFFEAIIEQVGLTGQIEIWDFKGVNDLSRYLKVFSSTESFRTNVTSLGIARDAERNRKGAAQAMERAVEDAKIPAGVKIQYLVVPDDAESGMLETIMQRSFEGLPVFGQISQFFEAIAAHGYQLLESPKHAKQFVQVYMAAKGCVQMHAGIAAKKRAFELTHGAFDSVRDFVQNL